MSIKNFFFAPLASGLGATRRAAVLLLVMLLTTATAWAQSPWGPPEPSQETSGSCGDDLTWELTQHEYDTFYTLTISGEGAMADYDYSNKPWKSYAEQINEVVIENRVTSIGEYAFSNCHSLGSVTIPNSVTSIGEYAFFCCSLESVTFAEGSKLKSIGANAFDGTALTSIEIPASVTSIGNYAFSGTSMTSIEIPASVTSIGEAAFWSCNYLESVTFAEGSQLKSIGKNAFQNCFNLTSITIPASVTSIGSDVFLNCDNLTSITVEDGNTVYDSRNGCNAIIEKSTNTLIIGCKNSTIPASVTSIGESAFYGCTGLTSIEIPASVTSIGAWAFANCIGLTSIEIPASVTSIGERAFLNCPNLATVTVYTPSCSLGVNAFADCGSLTNIYVFSDLVDDYKAAENWSTYAGKITAIPTVNTSYVDAVGTLHVGVEAIPLNNAMTTLPAGTYVVNSDVAYTGTVTLSGNVTLILGDDCTMSFGTEDEELLATIMECQNHNLTIYGQSGGTGWLKAYAQDYGINHVNYYTQYSGNVVIFDVDGACINADNSVTLLGGTLDVKSGGGDQGDIFALLDINILGGKLWAREKGLKTMNGKIILGYTKPTDEIYAYSYQHQDGLQIADGQTLVDDDGYIWSGTLVIENEINNRTLKPLVYSGVTLTGNGLKASATFDGTSTTTVSIPVDVNVTSVTYNRVFTEGKPSTVMLPFSLGEGQTLTGGTLYKFTGVTKNETAGKWEATMTETSTLQANTPYLLMPNNELVDGKVTFNLGSSWSTVTLNTTGGGNGQTADEGSHWTFKGTYEYMKWTTNTEDDDYNAEREAEIGRAFGFAGVAKTGIEVGDFVKVASGAKIRPMGCYLLWNDEPNAANARALTRGAAATEEELPQRITVRLVGSNGETNAIGTLDTKTGEIDFSGWYDMSGHKLSGKPTKKGLYINNGRKIVIK